MSETKEQRPFPLMPLLGAAALIFITMVSAAWMSYFVEPQPAMDANAPVLAMRELRFEDRQDGAVLVLDAQTGEVVTEMLPGGSGFVRATLRGLARSRRALGIGSVEPFRLENRASGRLLLIDTATGQEVDLWAFGHINAQEFARLLEQPAKENLTATGSADSAEALSMTQ